MNLVILQPFCLPTLDKLFAPLCGVAALFGAVAPNFRCKLFFCVPYWRRKKTKKATENIHPFNKLKELKFSITFIFITSNKYSILHFGLSVTRPSLSQGLASTLRYPLFLLDPQFCALIPISREQPFREYYPI